MEWALKEGFVRCSVEFEATNVEACRFWLKYFEPVCRSMVWRLDERILNTIWEEAAQKTRGRDGPAPSLIAMTNRATRWSWSPGNVQTAYLPTLTCSTATAAGPPSARGCEKTYRYTGVPSPIQPMSMTAGASMPDTWSAAFPGYTLSPTHSNASTGFIGILASLPYLSGPWVLQNTM